MPPFRQNPQSHQYPFPAEYRGPPMAEGKDRAPHARWRGLATVLLTSLLSLAAQTGRWWAGTGSSAMCAGRHGAR